jgi:outer membrane protein OmpA-like peptidoglycan-associated protein
LESERRQSERSDVFLIVEFRPLNKKTEFLQGVTENISHEGFNFDSQSHSFNTGEILEFKLKQPQGDLSVSFSGEIIWKREAWYKSVTGVKFKDVNIGIENKITELISFLNNRDAEPSATDSEGAQKEEQSPEKEMNIAQKEEMTGETLQDDIKAGPEKTEKGAATPAEGRSTADSKISSSIDKIIDKSGTASKPETEKTDDLQGIRINPEEPQNMKQQVNKEPLTFDRALKEEKDRGKKRWLYISLAAVFIVVSIFVLSGRFEDIKQELTAFTSSINLIPSEDVDEDDIIAFRDDASPGSMAEPEPFETVEVPELPQTLPAAEIDEKDLAASVEDISPGITIKPELIEPVQLNNIPEVSKKLPEEEKKDIKEDHLPLLDLEVNIAFGRNSDVVDPGFDSAIDKIADVLLNDSRAAVKVIGHTDSVGAGAYNLDLSIRRASSVKNLLVQRGIDSSRIEIMGLGHLSPLAPNDTASGRKRNRRVVMKIAFP